MGFIDHIIIMSLHIVSRIQSGEAPRHTEQLEETLNLASL
jgi:hypothetical protein